jgi:hypothetical protein
MKNWYFILALAAGLAATGCTRLKGPGGWSYTSYIFQKKVGELEVTTATNGAITIKLKGYESEAANLARATAEGVAKGLGKAIAP